MSTTEITTRHEVEVDTRIADAHDKLARANAKVAQLRKAREWDEKHRRPISLADEGRFEEACVESDNARAELEEVEVEYAGWSRFFIVKNNGGHIHRSMGCSTCFPTTVFGWLPELSGLTEAEAVAEWGEILCSVCFPSAPVEWTQGVNKKEAEAKALDAALKAIAKSPEGKKVKSATELVSSKQYRIERCHSALARAAEEPYGDEHPAWVIADAAKAEVDLPKYEQQLAKAVAKLAAAEAALEEVLTS